MTIRELGLTAGRMVKQSENTAPVGRFPAPGTLPPPKSPPAFIPHTPGVTNSVSSPFANWSSTTNSPAGLQADPLVARKLNDYIGYRDRTGESYLKETNPEAQSVYMKGFSGMNKTLNNYLRQTPSHMGAQNVQQ